MIDDSAFAAATRELPGAVGLIADREGVRYAKAFGVADADTGRAMQVRTLCQISSMTKALVGVGAMQLVEQGRLSLDDPIGAVLPELAAPQVLTGFGEDGVPQTRAATRPITLRHLLTHTAGFGYSFVQADVLRYYSAVGMPEMGSRKMLDHPLLFEPGTAWEYGVGIDWVGQAIERVVGTDLGAYLEAHLFAPLGMRDTAFLDALPGDAARVHIRNPDGGFSTISAFLGGGEFQMGGGGLTSTAPDYGRFVRMILRGGELDGERVLKAETVADMSRNHVGPIRAGYMGSAMPELAPPFDTFPDQHTGWGLSFLINPDPGPAGRSAGSLAWAGIFNSYYWIDPAAGVAGVMMCQLSPFGDPQALEAFAALERMAYS